MSRGASTYQLQDVQTVVGWLGDPGTGTAANATLLASIATVTTGWLGFYPALQLIDTSQMVQMSVPVPPATLGVATNPKAGAAWRLSYGTDLSERRALGGGLLEGLPAILYMTLLVQPHVALQTPYTLAQKIRDGVAALAAAAGMPPNPSIPIAQTFDVGKWSAWSILIRFWSVTP